MDYKKLLEKARESLPEDIRNTSRFEIPKVIGHIQGNNTIISNFFQIAKHLNRDQGQLLKYVLKELATPGKINGQRIIFGSKISAKLINSKIKQYVLNYVLCAECRKPDTKLIEEKGQYSIKCTACGAMHPVRRL